MKGPLYSLPGKNLNSYSPPPHLRKLDMTSELYVIGLVLDNPSLYVGEICQQVYDDLGITISMSSLSASWIIWNNKKKSSICSYSKITCPSRSLHGPNVHV